MTFDKTTNIPRWRHQAAVEGLLRTLATCMAPEDADLHDFREYLEANEFGLALDELAAVVNGRGRKRELP